MGPPRYVPGSIAVNWNTLNRIHDALLALNFTEEEMYIMYPGGEARNAMGQPTGTVRPGGPPLPAWIDAGTRARDLEAAFDAWLRPDVNANTQVFFWSNWGHGNRGPDAAMQRRQAGGQVQRGVQMSFESEAEFGKHADSLYRLYNGQASLGTLSTPNFEIDSTISIPGLSVQLNGRTLSLLEELPDVLGNGSRWVYRFALDRSDIDSLMASLTHSVVIDYAAGLPSDAFFIDSMGPTLGDLANGLSFVPEPMGLSLVAMGVLCWGLLARAPRRGGAYVDICDDPMACRHGGRHVGGVRCNGPCAAARARDF
jgi:hypothetical protein